MPKKGRRARTAKPGKRIRGKKEPLKILVTWKVINRGLLSPLFVLSLVLLSAWNFDYWQGWFFGILNAVAVWASMYLLRNRKPPAEEKPVPGKGVKRWDRWYIGINALLTIAVVVGSAMDAGHIHVSPPLPFPVYGLGLILFASGHGLLLWAKTVNERFSAAIGPEPGKDWKVCTEGPYGYLRHPGYAGGILYSLGTPLLLGSLWGLIPAFLAAVLLSVKTGLEDRSLMAGTKGYRAYCRDSKFRLIPKIW